MTARSMLVGDVPLHVASFDSIHDALTVMPAQTAPRAHGLTRLKIREAIAGPFVKGAPVAGRLNAAVVIP
jgi:hypothetical protein